MSHRVKRNGIFRDAIMEILVGLNTALQHSCREASVISEACVMLKKRGLLIV